MINIPLHQQLEQTFTRIQQERMEGVPVLNNRLSVKAIGFHQWKDYQLGILVTPWFMNLILLPNMDEISSEMKVGNTKSFVFPSGVYDFIVGHEKQFGFYLNCSLFSPMFEFEDQAAAELTAKEALAAIMNEENFDRASQHRTQEIAEIWAGEKTVSKNDERFDPNDPNIVLLGKVDDATPHKIIKETSSRRDFLRGRVFHSDSEL